MWFLLGDVSSSSVLGMGYVILLWHSLSLPYNYFALLESAEEGKIHERIRQSIDGLVKWHN